ncbi:MAG: 1-(5-phosphoribosyl)-5-[(5-phosphoribosylamino) methylideneamino] imidazole-4-carboxamide isomerase [Thermonema sp.]|jgi:phosphoribosylformimino-5-aminoimidazole carboxamide ribotide isomerase|uniref:1-(5-phosphoribosyl)-5-[(5- phosphoribosylamino)methylideneamino]imidazole-4- carboxamide isomerase n=1 Tax=Thermonema TaxID=28194 RepID=UPI000571362E|nr:MULTISPECIES: 1-(5-phosphoribosyl)-5-[(5-phosphoribosylamino)methylideneamino]imidazole-4-carboxamide isomerase [Thermonema]GIV39783.1 MAG: 1-(5-phosphoribosyl)-5-[(5-phosphoribosylamino) methylideneamino] imidazole-4-carboxamide isomerase [Thermonema sp.]
MKIIPAIDLIGGKCVRLRFGDYNQKTEYYEDPLEAARQFEAAGITHLHLVDLDGAKQGQPVNIEVLERIAAHTHLQIDFGGGIRKKEDIERVLAAGAVQVTVGSLAVKQPETVVEWLHDFGPEKLIIGADIKDGKIAVNAWQDLSKHTAEDFLQFYARQGARYVVCTDISRDGSLQGTNVEFYRHLQQQCPELHFIASGGVASISDLLQLQAAGLYGVIVGKAIYEGYIQLTDLAKLIKNNAY